MCPYQPRVRHTPGRGAQWLCRRVLRTSLLLLHGQLLPVGLHAVPQRHPEVGLLLGGHVIPSLLDVGKGRVGDGVGLADLLLLARGGRNADSLTCCRNNGAPRSSDNGGAEHGGGG